MTRLPSVKVEGNFVSKLLLILPCMNWGNYGFNFENSRFWKTVLRGIQPWRYCLDIYSIDCIRLKSTDQVLGLWSPYKDQRILHEIIASHLDSYPAWSRYKTNEKMMTELENAVRRKLLRVASHYEKIISFLNVKAYYKCMLDLSSEFDIIALPREVDWKAARAVPCRNLNELEDTLNRLTRTALIQPVSMEK